MRVCGEGKMKPRMIASMMIAQMSVQLLLELTYMCGLDDLSYNLALMMVEIVHFPILWMIAGPEV